MTKIITREAFKTVEDIIAAGKTPWVVLNDEVAVIARAGRAAAREAKAANGFNGAVEKYEAGQFELETPPKPAAPAPKADKEIVRKSTATGPCRLVWDIAERMEGQRRKDIIAACVEAGVAYYTARTQYQMWLTIRNEERAREAAQAAKKA